MFSTRSRTLAALAAGAILLAPLAGCGGADKGSDAKGGKTSSPTSSTVDTAKVDDFIASLVAAMQDKKTAHMILELGSSMSATAEVDYAGSGTQMALKMSVGSQKVQVVLANGAMYLQQKAGGKYTKIDKNDPAMGGLLDQLESIGPKASVTSMKAGIKKVANLGEETVDGETLTHYKLTVDTKRAAAIFGAPAGAAGTPKTITYDVFVDADKLLREVRMEITGQKLVMKVSDWGKPVSITVPSAAQVVTR